MSLDHAVYYTLNHAGLTVYPDRPVTETALPYVVYARQDTVTPYSLNNGAVGISGVTFIVETWASDKATLQTMTATISTALVAMSGQTVDGVAVQGCFLKDSETEEEERGFHARQLFAVWG